MTEQRARDPRWIERYGPWGLVTGASDGIGREIARQLAARGLNVVLVARRRAQLELLSAELIASFGIQTRIVAADLGSPDAVRDLLECSREIDVGLLAACAGFGTAGRFLDISASDEMNMIDVNCRAVLQMARHFAERFAARGRGGIILMSSIVAFQGVPNAANYAATKAFVQTLAEGLCRELRPLGIDVLASAPGPVQSGFAARSNMRMGRALTPLVVARETVAALGQRATVRPGLLSKILIGSLSTLPRFGRTAIMQSIMAGMTKHQHESQA